MHEVVAKERATPRRERRVGMVRGGLGLAGWLCGCGVVVDGEVSGRSPGRKFCAAAARSKKCSCLECCCLESERRAQVQEKWHTHQPGEKELKGMHAQQGLYQSGVIPKRGPVSKRRRACVCDSERRREAGALLTPGDEGHLNVMMRKTQRGRRAVQAPLLELPLGFVLPFLGGVGGAGWLALASLWWLPWHWLCVG